VSTVITRVSWRWMGLTEMRCKDSDLQSGSLHHTC
jgi:hypothetical protein